MKMLYNFTERKWRTRRDHEPRGVTERVIAPDSLIVSGMRVFLHLTNFSPYNDGCPSFACQADGVTLCWIEGQDLLQTNLMLPAIGQVIFVYPAFFATEVEVRELHLMRIVTEAYSPGLPDPVRLASNEELVQMLIGPAKRNLKRVMELGNGAVAAH